MPSQHAWDAFLAGATAAGYGQTTRKLITNDPPPATPTGRDQATDRFASLSDSDLLKEAVDGPDGNSRVAAMAVLTERVRNGKCCPKVAIIKGYLGRVNLKDSTQASRRDIAKMAVDRYGIEYTFWF